MNVQILDFNLGPLIAKLERVLPEAMSFMPEIVMEQARLIVSSSGSVPGMVQVLPPAHAGVKNAAAGKHGEAKVAADISRVYLSPSGAWQDIKDNSGEAAANAFYAALYGRAITSKKGTPRHKPVGAAEAERILRVSGGRYKMVSVGPFDGGAAHRSLRLKDGTVGKRVLPRLIVTNKKELDAYIEHKQGNVGILGSTFNRAASQFGASGMPSYVTRHGDKFSSVSILHTRTSFWIVMEPRINYGMAEINARWSYVLGYRMNAVDSRGYINRIKKVFLEPARQSAAA